MAIDPDTLTVVSAATGGAVVAIGYVVKSVFSTSKNDKFVTKEVYEIERGHIHEAFEKLDKKTDRILDILLKGGTYDN